MNNEIMVSICCITYNHEKYISEAIESFLTQKTAFKFEILMHDDASTDNTTQIVEEYQKKCPDIIKPIYQKENQYSKGVKTFTTLFSRAKGKYIALCEGDDYWTDKLKLQKQVDYMTQHTECSLCIHATKVVTINKKIKSLVRANIGNTILKVEDILNYRGTMFHTSSMLLQTKYALNLPNYYKNAPVGDAPLKMHLATKGSIYYIDDFMSAWRTNVPGSWTSKVMHDKQKASDHCDRMCKMLDEINEHSKYQYDSSINFRKKHYEFSKLLINDNYKEMKSIKCKVIYDRYTKIEKMKLFIQHYFPKVATIIKNIKRKFL